MMTAEISPAAKRSGKENAIWINTLELFSWISYEALPLDLIVTYNQKKDNDLDKEEICNAVNQSPQLIPSGDEDIRPKPGIHDVAKLYNGKNQLRGRGIDVRSTIQFVLETLDCFERNDTKILVEHLKAFVSRAKEIVDEDKALYWISEYFEKSGISRIYMHFGRILCQHREYQLSAEFRETILRIWNGLKGNISIFGIYDYFGDLSLELGELEDAKSYFEKQLEISKKLFASNHVSLVASYSKLAKVHQKLGKAKKAKDYHDRALEITKKDYDEDHVDVANVYCYLTKVEEGKNGEKDLKIRKYRSGSENVDVASVPKKEIIEGGNDAIDNVQELERKKSGTHPEKIHLSGSIDDTVLKEVKQPLQYFSPDVKQTKLCSGSRGTLVYVGILKDKSEVAVKRMIADDIAENEKKTLDLIKTKQSPFIVNYRHFFRDDTFMYLIFDLYEETLGELVDSQSVECLRQNGPRMIKQMLTGLEFLHALGILHRNLHPSNVLVDLDGRMRLAGFGISRAFNKDEAILYTSPQGTDGWMAAEAIKAIKQKVAGRHEKKSDVQVVGMLAYFILTKGEHAYGDLLDRMVNIVNGNPVNLEKLEDLDARRFVSWLISHKVEERPYAHEALKCSFIISVFEPALKKTLPELKKSVNHQKAIQLLKSIGDEKPTKLISPNLEDKPYVDEASKHSFINVNDFEPELKKSVKHREKIETLRSMGVEMLEKVKSPLRYFAATKSLEIGNSGATFVYVGIMEDESEVAVKRMFPPSSSEVAVNERSILSFINTKKSPFIVNYRHFFHDDTFMYLILDLCDETLSEHVQSQSIEYLQQDGPRMIKQILTGLEFLHGEGILHRDLKPANVLVDVDGCMRLSDFGISRVLKENESTHYTDPSGTMGWMAAEVINAIRDADAGPYKKKSDVQVVGMIAYFILTKGNHPFGDPLDRMENIVKGKPINVKKLEDLGARRFVSWLISHNIEERPYAHEALKCSFITDLEPELKKPLKRSKALQILRSTGDEKQTKLISPNLEDKPYVDEASKHSFTNVNDFEPELKKSVKHQEKIETLRSMNDEKLEKVKSPLRYFCPDESTKIGSGSNGTSVYVGILNDGSEVAVKRTITDSINEITILDLINTEKSPCIVNYRDCFKDDSFTYLVFDLCEETLKERVHSQTIEYLQQHGPSMIKQILSGLEFLHELGILHRDLKPSNVLVDLDGRMRLTDFGISRVLKDDRTTHYTDPKGTIGWVPAEVVEAIKQKCEAMKEKCEEIKQSMKFPYKKKSDVQVVGMIAFFILTRGEHPFGDPFGDPFDRMGNIVKGKPVNLKKLDDLDARRFISWLISHEIEERPCAHEALKDSFLDGVELAFEPGM